MCCTFLNRQILSIGRKKTEALGRDPHACHIPRGAHFFSSHGCETFLSKSTPFAETFSFFSLIMSSLLLEHLLNFVPHNSLGHVLRLINLAKISGKIVNIYLYIYKLIYYKVVVHVSNKPRGLILVLRIEVLARDLIYRIKERKRS